VNLGVLLQTIVSSYFRNTIFDVFQQKNRYNSRIQIITTNLLLCGSAYQRLKIPQKNDNTSLLASLLSYVIYQYASFQISDGHSLFYSEKALLHIEHCI